MANSVTQSILVVGGGMAGMTAALEAAEAGYDVILIEKNPYLGGRVAQLNQYFPKLCPPYCGLEINFKRMRGNRNIRFFTMAEVQQITGQAGDFDVKIKLNPRYVDETNSGDLENSEVCTQEIDNPFNYGMDKVKAIHLPHALAFPQRMVADPSVVKSSQAQQILDANPNSGLDFSMEAKIMDLNVGAIVWAAGWAPYDAKKLDTYGFGEYPNVITNVMMERLAAVNGPTGGKIVRPSDGQAPEKVAFIQCAGSRDENHLGFCSGICCLASLKQATYVRDKVPEADIQIFYIDIRATDRLEDFYTKVKQDPKVGFFKGKVAKITEDPATKDPILRVEDTTTGQLKEIQVSLAVLATGMQPVTAHDKIPIDAEVTYDDYGFVAADSGVPGLVAAGCARTPVGVSETVADGTAAALKAIQSIARR